MSFLLSFLGRRLLTGAAVRALTNLVVKRFRLSPGVGSIVFVVLTELIARSTERGSGSGRPRR